MKQALKGLVFALLLIAILSATALLSALAGVLATPLTLLPLVAQHPIQTLTLVVVLITAAAIFTSWCSWCAEAGQSERGQATWRGGLRERFSIRWTPDGTNPLASLQSNWSVRPQEWCSLVQTTERLQL